MQDNNDELKIDINLFNKLNIRVRDIAKQVVEQAILQHDFLALNTVTNEPCMPDESSVIINNRNKLYENNLPEGITLDTLETIDKYNKDFEAGVLLGIGEVTLSEMNKNPNITSSTSFTPMSDKRTLNTFICINEESDAVAINSLFTFKSNIKMNLPKENVTGELTQLQITRITLDDLYIKALCK